MKIINFNRFDVSKLNKLENKFTKFKNLFTDL